MDIMVRIEKNPLHSKIFSRLESVASENLNLFSYLFTFSDTITGMSLSPDGAHILTNSMDNTLRLFDIRPFAKNDRCLKLFTGHLHNFEKVRK